jgi:hypothetical protein
MYASGIQVCRYQFWPRGTPTPLPLRRKHWFCDVVDVGNVLDVCDVLDVC